MMRKRLLLAAPIAAILLLAAIALSCFAAQPAAPRAFAVGERSYLITDYASTPAQRDAGLMNRSVASSTFMLFSFGKPGIYPFWMKDTYAPLDMIWLRYNGTTGTATVVAFATVPPCINYSPGQNGCVTYTPLAPADYVLETRAGFAKRSRIRLGAQLRFLY